MFRYLILTSCVKNTVLFRRKIPSGLFDIASIRIISINDILLPFPEGSHGIQDKDMGRWEAELEGSEQRILMTPYTLITGTGN